MRRLFAALADSGRWLVAEPWRLVVVLLAAVAGAAAGVPAGNAAFHYTWKDARFCDDCHIHDYANEAWARSAHADLTTCHDCHRVPIAHYPRNLWMTAFDRPEGPEDIHAPDIPIVVCAQCHLEDGGHEPLTGPMPDEVRKAVVKVDHSPLHKAHLDAASRVPAAYQGGATKLAEGTIACMDCHGSESNRAHRFEPTTETCVACHQELHVPTRPAAVGGAAPPGSHPPDLTPATTAGADSNAFAPEALPCRQCHLGGFLAETK